MNDTIPKILFVDDEASILQALNRVLRPHRKSFEATFATSGQEALDRMENETFDILVTDMRMPGMNGAELLSEVIVRHPRTLRFVLSGQSSGGAILQAVIPAHRMLYKPCEPELLVSAIIEALANRDIILDEGLQGIVSQIQSLPSLPTLYMEVMKEIQNKDPSLKRIGELIGKDIGLYTKILRIVNSAFYGFGHYVSDPAQAVSLLGLKMIQSFTLLFGVCSQLEKQASLLENFSLMAFQDHSIAVAKMARSFAKSSGADAAQLESVFLAGLLHDIGWLILAAYLPEKIRNVKSAAIERNVRCYLLEEEVIGSTHSALGAYLLGLWGFPRAVIEIVSCHHEPWKNANADMKSVIAVHASDSLFHEGCADPSCLFCCQPDEAFLKENNLMAQFSAWKELWGILKLEGTETHE